MTWAIDVSLYDSRRWVFGQGWVYDKPIDWTLARNGGISLAIIKSSEGTWPDPAFKLNWGAAHNILPRMAYHFFRSNLDPIAQADYTHLMMATNDYDHNRDFVILDLETMDGQPASVVLGRARIFLERLTKYGYAPLIYTYPAFWRGIGGDLTATWAREYRLGLAQWPLDLYIANQPVNLFGPQALADFKYKIETGKLRPVALKPWDKCALWQFTSRVAASAVPGHPAIKKAVDYNKVYMRLADTPVIVPPPAAPPEPLRLYRSTALLLKVFANSGDQYKQVGQLTHGQEVMVLEYATSVTGETFARIDRPVGWVRANWLEKV